MQESLASRKGPWRPSRAAARHGMRESVAPGQGYPMRSGKLTGILKKSRPATQGHNPAEEGRRLGGSLRALRKGPGFSIWRLHLRLSPGKRPSRFLCFTVYGLRGAAPSASRSHTNEHISRSRLLPAGRAEAAESCQLERQLRPAAFVALRPSSRATARVLNSQAAQPRYNPTRATCFRSPCAGTVGTTPSSLKLAHRFHVDTPFYY
jgi:hypothetical protein